MSIIRSVASLILCEKCKSNDVVEEDYDPKHGIVYFRCHDCGHKFQLAEEVIPK